MDDIKHLLRKAMEANRSLESAILTNKAYEVGKASRGVKLIERERSRQISEEGFDRVHDEEHDHCELVLAAISYLFSYLCDGWTDRRRSGSGASRGAHSGSYRQGNGNKRWIMSA